MVRGGLRERRLTIVAHPVARAARGAGMNNLIWQPSNRQRYLFNGRDEIAYLGARKYKPPFILNGRFASFEQGAEASLIETFDRKCRCEAMETWSDQTGSAVSFKHPDSPDHETLLYEDTEDFDAKAYLHDEFFEYEIAPDEFTDFWQTNKARLRIQYWAVIETYFASGGKEGEDLLKRIVSGGFRDWGAGALRAYQDNLPQDAIIIGEFVTIRFNGRLAP